jgi:hypothetical protein
VTDVSPSTGERPEPSGAGPLGVVVVSTEPSRLTQYRAALRMAGVTALLTDDADEAEGWVQDRLPAALVLDQGLPRVTVFRLYGLVRDNAWARGISVLFVGQEGEGGPGDYYLPADASPLAVAAQAQELARQAEQAHQAEAAAKAAAATADEAADAPGASEASDEAATSDLPAMAAAPAAAASGARPTSAPTTAAPAPSADAEEPVVATRSGRRLDVILFRSGLVLLILGAAMIFLRPEASTPPTPPPTVAPATPTRLPAASPSPAAYFGGAVLGR